MRTLTNDKRKRLNVAKHELLTSVAWAACLPSKCKINCYPRLKPHKTTLNYFIINLEYILNLSFTKK